MIVDVVVDVEADGQCPGLYSMVSFGAAWNGGGYYSGVIRPLSNARWDPAALAISGVTREEQLAGRASNAAMYEFSDVLRKTFSDDVRLVFWSDNLAFDWQFINYYFYMTLQTNPFGHSGRRIGDLYAGIKGDIRAASKWKSLRDTKHTHHPLEDAYGNLEALNKIKEMIA